MPLDPQAPEFYYRLHRRLQSSRSDLLAYLLTLNLTLFFNGDSLISADDFEPLQVFIEDR